MSDLPAGKENTTMCTTPLAVIKQNDGFLLQLAAQSSEVLLIASSSSKEPSMYCVRLQTMIDDIIDQWPHSQPHIPVSTVLSTRAPGKVCIFAIFVYIVCSVLLLLLYPIIYYNILLYAII